MNKNYVILDIKTNGDFNLDDNIKITFIVAIKIDKRMNRLAEIKLDMNNDENNNVIEFVNFCKNCNIIIYNRKNTLSFILKMLYKNKFYNKFEFRYIDIIDVFKNKIKENIKISLDEIKKYYKINVSDNIYIMNKIIANYLKENCIDNLDKLLFIQPNHGRIFRGLNYPKYLCDIKTPNNTYYGYIIDLSKDKYVSYYSCLKEINCEYFNIDEISMMKNLNAKIIMNVRYLCEEMLIITEWYSVQAIDSCKINSECKNLLNGIDNYVNYKKNNKNLKLILWGSIDKFKETYNSVDNSLINEFIKLIDVIKEPWDNWNKKEL